MILALSTEVATIIQTTVYQKAIIEEAFANGWSVFIKYFSYIYMAYVDLTQSLFFFHLLWNFSKLLNGNNNQP